MTRTALLIALVVLAVGAGVLMGAGDDAAGGREYEIVLDNSFGLTEGTDLRSSGVKVGTITDLDVERETARALVTAKVDKPSFAGFRKDVFCEVQPQSLIGEYFMNCTPGTAKEPAPERIAVEQTGGTIPPDLVQNILRRPARERFAIILAELGAGVGARGEDLSATIRRAVPALRETDRVLRLLGDNRRTLTQLTRDSDAVLTRLAGNKDDVTRFVSEARDTAAVSASRRERLAETVRKLPGFLRELRPTLASLGTAAARQTPALADLRAGADRLETLFERLGPFAEASRPAVRSLGRTSRTGQTTAREARSTVRRLRELGRNSTEPMRNLRFVLEDLDDRDRAVEPNRLSPTGRGFTGLEALLQYPFVQSQAVNLFDSKGYMLKLNILANECGAFTNAETAREDAERTKRCGSPLGPNQPGVNTAVSRSSGDEAPTRPRRAGADEPAERGAEKAPRGERAPPQAPADEPAPQRIAPPARNPLQGLLDRTLPELSERLPDLDGLKLGGGAGEQRGGGSDRDLLDFLLGP